MAELLRPRLEGEHFDVAVIGGGINGVAIARECARAGKRTLLLEKNDFASGTTSRSTRIIHGGLRYLEHGEIGLVRESLRERDRLLAERPHLVRRTQFLLAIAPSGLRRSALSIRTGLWLYGTLSGAEPAPRSDCSALERTLDRGEKLAFFSYDDAQCEFPERLVAEWLGEAAAAGALIRNHCEVLEIRTAHGRVQGLVARDAFSGEESYVSAAHIINATGPWVDRLCSSSGIGDQPLVGGVRGSHIVLRQFAGAPKQPLYVQASDGRPVFVIPWNGHLLVGTTEVRDNGNPDDAAPTPDEVGYLLQAAATLFPNTPISFDDIVYTFAGIRPLVNAPGTEPAAVTRRHRLHDHASSGAAGMISVVGGKLTTAAALARECVRKLGVKLPEPAPAIVAPAPSDGIVSSLRQWSRQVARMASISEASAHAIAEWHGRRALCVARRTASTPAMREPLCPHSLHLASEAVEAFEFEHAATLADVLLRRVPVALSGCWNRDCSSHAASAVGRAMHWSEHRIQSELEAFNEERALFLRKPEVGAISLPEFERAA